MRRLLIIAALLLCAAATTLSAQRTLNGKVTDYDSKQNRPLAGVAVSAEGTSAITRTDASGKFTLNVPAAAKTLIFALPGYATARVELTAVNQYDITLRRNAPLLEEEKQAVDWSLVDTIPVAALLDAYGQIELTQVLNYASPLFASNRQTQAGPSDHVDPVQLRGLGSDQLLVLVDGKRWHQSALVHTDQTAQRGQAQGFDWGAIPASAVERIEVSRDVAPSQYGSEAAAGVVNIVLKKKTGLDAQVSYGQRFSRFDKNYGLWKYDLATGPDVSANDGQTLFAGLHYGVDLAGKGRLDLSGEYLSRGATNRSGAFTGKVSPSGFTDSLFFAQNALSLDDFEARIGEAQMKGGAALASLELQLSDAWDFFATGSFSQRKGEASTGYYTPNWLESNTGFIWDGFVKPLYPYGFLPLIQSQNRNLSAAAGLRGELGGWALEFSNVTGQNRLDFDVSESINFTEYGLQVNQPQTDFEAGGMQLFQNTARADISRRFEEQLEGFSLGAGLEHRLERFGIRQGEEKSYLNYYNITQLFPSGSQGFAGYDDSTGTHGRNSIGAYVRAEQEWAGQFNISGTLRFDRYSDFGNALGGKLALFYSPDPVVTFHASAGLGFRAPSIQQLYYAKTIRVEELYRGQAGIFAQGSEAVELYESGELKPEKNLGFSAGLTLKPVEGLRVTLDAWRLAVDDRILLTNPLRAGNNGAIDTALRQLGVVSVSFWDNAVDTRSFGVEGGLNWVKSFGERQSLRFDVQAAWYRTRITRDANDRPKVAAPQIVASSGQSGQYLNFADQNRIEGALPRFKLVAAAQYSVKGFETAVRAGFFGGTLYRDPFNSQEDNLYTTGAVETLNQDFGSKTVLDLSLSYAFTTNVRLTLGVHNLLDTYPDRHTHSQNADQGRLVYSTQAQQFGFAGRMLFARVGCAF